MPKQLGTLHAVFYTHARLLYVYAFRMSIFFLNIIKYYYSAMPFISRHNVQFY